MSTPTDPNEQDASLRYLADPALVARIMGGGGSVEDARTYLAGEWRGTSGAVTEASIRILLDALTPPALPSRSTGDALRERLKALRNTAYGSKERPASHALLDYDDLCVAAIQALESTPTERTSEARREVLARELHAIDDAEHGYPWTPNQEMYYANADRILALLATLPTERTASSASHEALLALARRMELAARAGVTVEFAEALTWAGDLRAWVGAASRATERTPEVEQARGAEQALYYYRHLLRAKVNGDWQEFSNLMQGVDAWVKVGSLPQKTADTLRELAERTGERLRAASPESHGETERVQHQAGRAAFYKAKAARLEEALEKAATRFHTIGHLIRTDFASSPDEATAKLCDRNEADIRALLSRTPTSTGETPERVREGVAYRLYQIVRKFKGTSAMPEEDFRLMWQRAGGNPYAEYADNLLALIADRAAPTSTRGEPERRVMEMADKHAHRWKDKPEPYWLARLMQEVGELGSSLVGDHPDPVEHELAQVASIAINWLRLLAAPDRAAPPIPVPDSEAAPTGDVWLERQQQEAIRARDILGGGDELTVPIAVSAARRAAYRAADSYLAAVNAILHIRAPTHSGEADAGEVQP